MKRIVPIILTILTACTSSPAQSLEALKSRLGTTIIGSWEIIEKTNPSIGPMLLYRLDSSNDWQGFISIFSFPQDNDGRIKAEFYMSTCAAPMYVLGATSNITVLTSWKRTNEVCQRIVSTLGLTPPNTNSDSDKWINDGIIPAPRKMK